MSNEPHNSRLDSLIGIFRAFLRIDPMMALIAILIIAPIALPIGSAILNGETEVMITFVLFIGSITLVVYIPLIIVRANVSKEEIYSKLKKKSITEEIKSRQADKQYARERTDKIVNARISNMEAQTKAIIDNIPHFERFLLHEEAENIREALDLDMKDEGGMNSRLGLVIEAFESVNRKFDILEKIVPSLQKTVEEVKNFFLEKDSIMPEAVLKQMEGMASMIQDLNDKLLAKESEEPVPSDRDDPPDDLKFDQEETTSVFTDEDIPDMNIIEPSPFRSKDIPAKIQEKIIPKPEENLPPESKERFKDALDVVGKMEDSFPLPPIHVKILEVKPLNYWECDYCGNKNPLKAPRCRKCAKGKKIVEES